MPKQTGTCWSCINSTLAVFQLPGGWLKATAFSNMPIMLIILAVFQLSSNQRGST
jgi:hypothetical protein